MGNSQSSELQLAVMANILVQRVVPPTDRSFWDKLLSMGASPSDIYDNFTLDILRAVRDRQPQNFATLLKLTAITLHSITFRVKQTRQMMTSASLSSPPLTTSSTLTSSNLNYIHTHKPLLLNCLRLLTRLLSVIAEAPQQGMREFVMGGVLVGMVEKVEEERLRREREGLRKEKERKDREEAARRKKEMQEEREREDEARREEERRAEREAKQAQRVKEKEGKEKEKGEQDGEGSDVGSAVGGEEGKEGEAEAAEGRIEKKEEVKEEGAIARVLTVDGDVEEAPMTVVESGEGVAGAGAAVGVDEKGSSEGGKGEEQVGLESGQAAVAEGGDAKVVSAEVTSATTTITPSEAQETATAGTEVNVPTQTTTAAAPASSASNDEGKAEDHSTLPPSSQLTPPPPSASSVPYPASLNGAKSRVDPPLDDWWTGQVYGEPLSSVLISLLIDLSFLPSFTTPSNPTPSITRHNLHLGLCWSPGVGYPPKLASTAYSTSLLNPSAEWELDSNRVEVLRCLLVAVSSSMFCSKPMVGDGLVKEVVGPWHEMGVTLAFSMLNVVLGYRAEEMLPYSSLLQRDYRAPLVEVCSHLLMVLLDAQGEDDEGVVLTEQEEKGRASSSLSRSESASSTASSSSTSSRPPRVTIPDDSAVSRAAVTTHRHSNPASQLQAESNLSSPSPTSSNLFVDRLFSLSPADQTYLYASICRLLHYGCKANATYLPGSSSGISIEAELFVLLWQWLDRDPSFLCHVLDSCDILSLVTPLLYYVYQSRLESSKLGLLYTCVFILLKLSGERQFSVALNAQIGSVPHLAHIPLLSLLAFPDFTDGTYADALIHISHQLIISSPTHLDALLKVLLTLLCNISPYLTRLSSTSSIRLLALFELFTEEKFLYSSPTHHQYVLLLLDFFCNMIQYQWVGAGWLVLGIVRRARAFYALRVTAPGESYTSPMTGVGAKGHAIVFQSQRPPTTPRAMSATQPLPQPTDASAPDLTTSTNLAHSQSQPPPTPSSAFQPTDEWAASWKSRLPLEPIYRLLDFLLPKIESMARSTPHLTDAAILSFIQSQTLVGILPLPHPIVVRRYIPNPHTNLWFSTYLWGLIFVRQQQGEVKLWDGKRVKLFVIGGKKGGEFVSGKE